MGCILEGIRHLSHKKNNNYNNIQIQCSQCSKAHYIHCPECNVIVRYQKCCQNLRCDCGKKKVQNADLMQCNKNQNIEVKWVNNIGDHKKAILLRKLDED